MLRTMSSNGASQLSRIGRLICVTPQVAPMPFPPSFRSMSTARHLDPNFVAALEATVLSFTNLWGKNTLILGLDVSSSSSGVAVLQANGHLRASFVVRPPPSAGGNGGAILAAGACLRHEFIQLSTRTNLSDSTARVGEIAVEDFAMAYRPASTTANTLATLARMNGIAAFEACMHFSAPVLAHHPTTARGYFGLAAPRSAASKGQHGEATGDGGEGSADGEKKAKRTAAASARAESKRLVLDYVLRYYPQIQKEQDEREAADAAAAAAATPTSEAAVSDADTALSGSKSGGKKKRKTAAAPRKPSSSSAAASSSSPIFDQADAILIAMYALAQRAEWACLAHDGGALFKAHVAACLPGARLGKTTVSPSMLPAVEAALLVLHKQALTVEARRRRIPSQDGSVVGVPKTGLAGALPPPLGGLDFLVPASGGGTSALAASSAAGGGNALGNGMMGTDGSSGAVLGVIEGEAEGMPVPTSADTARSKRKKRAEAIQGAGVSLPAEVDAETLARLYNRLREKFSAQVKSALLGKVWPWRLAGDKDSSSALGGKKDALA